MAVDNKNATSNDHYVAPSSEIDKFDNQAKESESQNKSKSK